MVNEKICSEDDIDPTIKIARIPEVSQSHRSLRTGEQTPGAWALPI